MSVADLTNSADIAVTDAPLERARLQPLKALRALRT